MKLRNKFTGEEIKIYNVDGEPCYRKSELTGVVDMENNLESIFNLKAEYWEVIEG